MATDSSQPLSPLAGSILQSALGLGESERATVAAEIIASLDPEVDDDADVLWAHEIVRRVEELKSGSVETVPWEEARRLIREAGERALER